MAVSQSKLLLADGRHADFLQLLYMSATPTCHGIYGWRMKPAVKKVRCISSIVRMVDDLAHGAQHSFTAKSRLKVAVWGGGERLATRLKLLRFNKN